MRYLVLVVLIVLAAFFLWPWALEAGKKLHTKARKTK